VMLLVLLWVKMMIPNSGTNRWYWGLLVGKRFLRCVGGWLKVEVVGSSELTESL